MTDLTAAVAATKEPAGLAALASLREEMEQIRSRMKEAAQEAVREGTKAIFEEYGDIVLAFGWAQYTPFFNDGEPCEFGMSGLFILGHEDIDWEAVEREGYDGSWEDWAREHTDYPHESGRVFNPYDDNSKVAYTSWRGDVQRPGEPRYNAAKEAIENVYSALAADESVSKDIFGDHVRVLFTAEGVDTDYYDHD